MTIVCAAAGTASRYKFYQGIVARELKKQLAELQSSKADALAQKNVLDEQNNLLQSQIDNASAQITALESELAENQKKEEAQYELFCE